MQTASSGNPSIVKFSPNCPWTKSVVAHRITIPRQCSLRSSSHQFTDQRSRMLKLSLLMPPPRDALHGAGARGGFAGCAFKASTFACLSAAERTGGGGGDTGATNTGIPSVGSIATGGAAGGGGAVAGAGAGMKSTPWPMSPQFLPWKKGITIGGSIGGRRDASTSAPAAALQRSS